jgi:hypothetical protein
VTARSEPRPHGSGGELAAVIKNWQAAEAATALLTTEITSKLLGGLERGAFASRQELDEIGNLMAKHAELEKFTMELAEQARHDWSRYGPL